MPKAPIYEYGQSLGSKNEIWPPGNVLMPSPTPDVMLTQDGDQLQFRVLVTSGPYGGHDPRPHRFGEDVGHSVFPEFPVEVDQVDAGVGKERAVGEDLEVVAEAEQVLRRRGGRFGHKSPFQLG